ncbi:MAG: hypothetical protein ABIA76_03670 [Candidatus Diapherotrites archaeon]
MKELNSIMGKPKNHCTSCWYTTKNKPCPKKPIPEDMTYRPHTYCKHYMCEDGEFQAGYYLENNPKKAENILLINEKQKETKEKAIVFPVIKKKKAAIVKIEEKFYFATPIEENKYHLNREAKFNARQLRIIEECYS